MSDLIERLIELRNAADTEGEWNNLDAIKVDVERLNGLVALQKKDMKAAMDDCGRLGADVVASRKRIAKLEALLNDPLELRLYINKKLEDEKTKP